MAEYEYIGDVNLECGGIYINMASWEAYGYADAVEVCDLDSATGFTGAVYIRTLSLLKPDSPEKLKQVLSVVGQEDETDVSPLDVAYASFAYGYYDGDVVETLQLDPDGDMESQDGWKADKRAPEGFDLKSYVEGEYLK